jgi:hypothetical protein
MTIKTKKEIIVRTRHFSAENNKMSGVKLKKEQITDKDNQ